MEAVARFGVFLVILAACAAAEQLLPRRPKMAGTGRRWAINLGILAVDVVIQRLTVGAAAIGAALWAESRGIGLFHVVAVPGWLAGVLAFLAFDLAIWAQHVVTHKVPVLWRLHQVHHADLDVDLTTGLRFHPVEIVLSALLKAALAIALGAPALAVLIFEVVLNASSIFTHANIGLPASLDRRLRWLMCTPDMHRVHHSIERIETDSNYGFFLSVWDRLFRTMRAAPALGQGDMVLGLEREREAQKLGLGRLLTMPFERGAS